MKRISSNYVLYYKKYFSIIFVLILFIFGTFTFISIPSDVHVAWKVLFFCLQFFFLGIFFAGQYELLKDLTDEVFDFGSYLLVRNNGLEEKIFISDIAKINTHFLYLQIFTITMILNKKSSLGQKITFAPLTPENFNLLSPLPRVRHEISESLIERINNAKLI